MSLNLQVPTNALLNEINMNDDIQVQIIYNGNSDNVYFSISYLYEGNSIASKQYSGTNFTFKVWDLYSNFDPNQPTFVVRVSLIDPTQQIPSWAAVTLTLNFPPFIGNLTATPVLGQATSTSF